VFATLLGALPRPTDAPAHTDELIRVALRAQEDAGLEPITDGRLGGFDFERLPTPEAAVDAWRSTQGMTERAVKQALPGPFALGGGVEMADALAEVMLALAEAGCPLIEVEESGLERLGDESDRRRFRGDHERMLAKAPGTGTHLSLSIVGGSPGPDAWATVLELPYASLAVDLIAGPDSWNLVTRWAGERGVIAGVESAAAVDEPKEVLLWAAHYAASTKGRGRDRVGIGSAGSWANLTWDAAVRKMRLLGDVARLATMPPSEELARSLDPKAVSSRRAALGHDV
jgi:methionine synthase II (cobalamin-independent)